MKNWRKIKKLRITVQLYGFPKVCILHVENLHIYQFFNFDSLSFLSNFIHKY